MMVKKSASNWTRFERTSLIIDIRNDLYQVREKISFEVELAKTVSTLRDQIRPTYQIDVDFSVKHLLFTPSEL